MYVLMRVCMCTRLSMSVCICVEYIHNWEFTSNDTKNSLIKFRILHIYYSMKMY